MSYPPLPPGEAARRKRERNDAYAKTPKARARFKTYYRENKARLSAQASVRHRRKKYGVTPEQYDQMLLEQGGVCPICGGKP